MKKRNNNNNEAGQEMEIIAEEVETEHDLKVLNDCWHISVHPRGENNTGKIDPRSQIKKLSTIGKIKRFEAINDRTEKIIYTGYELDFKCEKTKNEIELYLNELRDDFKIRILPPNSSISEYIELIGDLSGKNRRIGDILKEIGTLTESELNEVLTIQKELQDESDPKKEIIPMGELLIKERMVQESVIAAALKKQKNININS